MSGSPKHCSVTLSDEREEQLRREREQQARLEAQRRAKEAEHRQQERLNFARSAANAAIQRITGELQTAAASTAARFVAAELNEIEAARNELQQQMKAAADPAGVENLRLRCEELSRKLKQVVARGEAELRAENLQHEEAAAAVLRSLFEGMNRAQSLMFDAPGNVRVRELLTQAEAAIERDALGEAKKLVKNAKSAFEAHRAKVDAGVAKHAANQLQAEQTLAAAQDTVVGLGLEDSVVARWRSDQLAELRACVARAEELLKGGQFEECRAALANVQSDARRLIEAGEAVQLQEDRRACIVEGIVKVMKSMGFDIEPDPPQLAIPNASATDTHILGLRKATQQAISVAVPREGELSYSIGGYGDHMVEVQEDGSEATVCDTAESQIHALHEQLLANFGIKTGNLWWEDQNPDRMVRKQDQMQKSEQSNAPRHLSIGSS